MTLCILGYYDLNPLSKMKSSDTDYTDKTQYVVVLHRHHNCPQ